jgi:hypothetical protein
MSCVDKEFKFPPRKCEEYIGLCFRVCRLRFRVVRKLFIMNR